MFLYGGYINDAVCTEFIPCMTEEGQATYFSPFDPNQLLPPTFQWDARAPYWKRMNHNVIEAMQNRVCPRDIICLIGGQPQAPIAQAFPEALAVEFGIGYSGVFAPYRVYESYAWMHYLAGRSGDDNMRHFDAVIPNYFDPTDFTFQEQKDDYLLFVGRIVQRKGLEIASEIARHAGLPLVIAGQGAEAFTLDDVQTVVAPEITLSGSHLRYVGPVDTDQRCELMASARALLVPTTYLEPFGGVTIEAMLSGTPVITTDYGAFAETVVDHVSGFRFRTLGEGVWAAQNTHLLNPHRIREHAVDNYSLGRVGELYEAYFGQLHTLYGEGWYDLGNLGVSEYERYRRSP